MLNMIGVSDHVLIQERNNYPSNYLVHDFDVRSEK